MLNIAIKCKSARDKKAYFTIPGLGDRIHILTCAWALSDFYGQHVRVHLSFEKYSEKKYKSLTEILSLFPNKSLSFQYHNILPDSELTWKSYIKSKIPEIKFFYYGDHRGTYETKEEIDISKFLKNFSKLDKPNSKIKVPPSNFILTQWDSTAASRSLPRKLISQIEQHYIKLGYDNITIGGQATNVKYKLDLTSIAVAMNECSYFVGVDSAFFHLAQLYLNFDQIKIYNLKNNYWSHHLLRFIDNGGIVNDQIMNMNQLDWAVIKLRHDSRNFKKIYHFSKNLLTFRKIENEI